MLQVGTRWTLHFSGDEIDANILALKAQDEVSMNKANQLTDFFSALRAHRDAYRWIRDRKHREWYAYAAAFSVGLICLNYWGAQVLNDWAERRLNEVVLNWAEGASAEHSVLSSWAVSVAELVLLSFDFVFWVVMFWMKIKVTKYLVLGFAGPLMSWISERVECEIRGMQYAFKWHIWIRDMARSLAVSILFFFIEAIISLLILFLIALSWVLFPIAAPGITLLFGIAAAILSSFFYGLSVFDPVWEREGLGVKMRFQQAWFAKASILGAGLPFHLWMSIPFVSAILSPIIAPVLCSVGAVLIRDRSEWQSAEKSNREITNDLRLREP